MDTDFQNQLDKVVAGMSQDELIDRIKKCQAVVDKLGDDKMWKTVIKDAESWVTRLDSKWQEIYDEKQLAHLRVLKLAYTHIASLPDKYKEDLQAAKRALDAIRNTDSSIQKDYDTETTIEGEE